jgi:hypothetical protein
MTVILIKKFYNSSITFIHLLLGIGVGQVSDLIFVAWQLKKLSKNLLDFQ